MIKSNIDSVICNLNKEFEYLIRHKYKLFNKKNKFINNMEFDLYKEYNLYKKQVAINIKNNFHSSVEEAIFNKIKKLYKPRNIIKRIFKKEIPISINYIEFQPVSLDVFKHKKYCFFVLINYQVNNMPNNSRVITINKLEDIFNNDI